MAEEDIGD